MADIGNLTEKVRSILLEDWDPLHVGTEPKAADEYHRYADHIIAMLRAGDGEAALAAYLADVETYQMGLRADLDRIQAAARGLRTLVS